MNYLLDTNLLVAALRARNGASNAIVQRVLMGDLPIAVHQKKLVYEYPRCAAITKPR
jgi:predicted nucleic acid-binding protein